MFGLADLKRWLISLNGINAQRAVGDVPQGTKAVVSWLSYTPRLGIRMITCSMRPSA